MAIRIIVDSTTDLPERYLEKVKVVPLTVRFGEEEYIDGVTITRNEFYQKMAASEELPKTSQPNPATFAEVFEEVTKTGDSAIALIVTGALSGTYQSACIAAEDFPNVRVVDTRNVALGTGILAEYAVACAEKGEMDLDELAAHLNEKKKDIRLLAVLDTLEYVVKGGRMSRAAGWAGTLLNIKPAITITDGEIEVLGKIRGFKKGCSFVSQKAKELSVSYDQPILFAYSGTEDTLLRSYLADSRELWEDRIPEPDISQLCSVIGTYVGHGAYAVAFFPASSENRAI